MTTHSENFDVEPGLAPRRDAPGSVGSFNAQPEHIIGPAQTVPAFTFFFLTTETTSERIGDDFCRLMSQVLTIRNTASVVTEGGLIM
ncbi:MAG: hypothetical protein RLZZ387_610 [Chloroflexota bacterium]|jgi:hypothetical protein